MLNSLCTVSCHSGNVRDRACIRKISLTPPKKNQNTQTSMVKESIEGKFIPRMIVQSFRFETFYGMPGCNLKQWRLFLKQRNNVNLKLFIKQY